MTRKCSAGRQEMTEGTTFGLPGGVQNPVVIKANSSTKGVLQKVKVCDMLKYSGGMLTVEGSDESVDAGGAAKVEIAYTTALKGDHKQLPCTCA